MTPNPSPSLPDAMRYAAPAVRNILKFHPDDVPDVLQDAALQAHLCQASFEGRSHYNSWFTRIAINQALMFLRSHKRIIESLDAPLGKHEMLDYFTFPNGINIGMTLRDASPSPEARAIEAERARALREEIAKLSACRRQEMYLALAEVNPGSDQSRKSRRWHARNVLRAALERRGMVAA